MMQQICVWNKYRNVLFFFNLEEFSFYRSEKEICKGQFQAWKKLRETKKKLHCLQKIFANNETKKIQIIIV